MTSTTKMKTKWERPTNLQPDWFFDIKEEDRAELSKQLSTNTELFDALRRVLENKYESTEITEYQFDTPSFHERLIYSEGYKKALRDIYKILPTKE